MDPIALFYYADDFCKVYEQAMKARFLPSNRPFQSQCALADSEIITIRVLYHASGYKTFKDFFTREQEKLANLFPNILSYSRFVELCSERAFQLFVFAKVWCTSASTGTNYVDSTKLEVCHVRRASSHRTFEGAAAKGKTSVGWFYGFKLHLVNDEYGNIVDFDLTPGNTADNNESIIRKITKKLFGKLFGDRGYLLNKELYAELFQRGLHVITKVRSNMKQRLIEGEDAIKLQKRGISETIIGILKETLSLEHSRHRSRAAFLVHIATTLIAYCFRPNKPSLIAKSRLLPA